MRRYLVYDLPTRIFHWVFAGLFITAFIIAKTIDDDSPTYSYHMLAGLTLSFVIVLRIIWGIFGSKHAKFSDFRLQPKILFNYFKGLFANEKVKWPGHNPATSWAAITMMLLGLGLGITGFLMTSGPNKETYEDIHELFANTFIIIVVFHIVGVVLHMVRNKDLIALSMIDGKKLDIEDKEVISSSHFKIGILLITLVMSFCFYLAKNFDRQSGKLSFFSTMLQLSKSESTEKKFSKDRDGDDDGDKDEDIVNDKVYKKDNDKDEGEDGDND